MVMKLLLAVINLVIWQIQSLSFTNIIIFLIFGFEELKSFFKNAQNKATELDIIMNWDLMVVPTKDGHGNTKQMVPYAAELFYERLR